MSDYQSTSVSARAIDDEAARWYARRDAGLTATEAAEFKRWLVADPRHADIWREFDDALGSLDSARELGVASGMVGELALRQRRRRWRTITGTAVVAFAVAACAVMLLRASSSLPRPVEHPVNAVVVISPELRSLPDGSTVLLNRGAAIEVAYSATRRNIRLLRGEAHFEVTKNLARPFVVTAKGVEVRAVGTAFSVEAEAAVVNVVVTHGRVAVERLSGTAAPSESIPMDPVYADAGHRVSVPVASAPQVTPIAPEEIDRELAWRGPRLELSGTSLADAVAAFNCESRVQLRIADQALAEVRMSGVFRADRSEEFARMLERHYGVRAERNTEGITLREAK